MRIAKRSEAGATTLVELLVATALAMVLLAMVGTLAYQIERSMTQDNAGFVAETGAMKNLSVALDNLSNGAQLGACVSPAAGTPLGQCTHVSSTGPVIEAAGPSGFCFYAYMQTSAGLTPPSLECVVAYPNSTATGQNIYSITYAPATGATYTSCAPSSCFGTDAPAPGALPQTAPNATDCSAQCNAKLVGATSTTSGPFTFYSQTGAVNVANTPSATVLASIQSVTVTAPVQHGTFGHKRQYTYTSSGAVSGNAYAEEESWAAIA